MYCVLLLAVFGRLNQVVAGDRVFWFEVGNS
jgi:hypothetical protein